MKVTRLLVLAVALGAGIIAALLAVQMSNRPPEQAPLAAVSAPPPPPDTIDVLVASAEISTGKRLSAADFTWQAFPKSGAVEAYVTRNVRPQAIEELSGSLARAPFLTGEPIREQRLMKAERGFMSVILSPGMRATAVEVKAVSTAGGFILPNDHVDILLTRAAPKSIGGEPYVSETILNNIRILAVDQQVSDNKGEAAMVAKDTVTLELTPRQTEIVAQAQQLGVISLALRSLRDQETPVVEDTDPTGGAVKVVRYGISSSVSIRR
ncbi:MAG: Flp pilus assembly protein CpaB [Siculibacillus sp.]